MKRRDFYEARLKEYGAKIDASRRKAREAERAISWEDSHELFQAKVSDWRELTSESRHFERLYENAIFALGTMTKERGEEEMPNATFPVTSLS